MSEPAGPVHDGAPHAGGGAPLAPELAGVEVGGVTRSAFILRGALAAASVSGAAAVGPFVSTALAQGQSLGDVGILNLALTLEMLEATFYARALKQLQLSPRVKQLIELIGAHEATHVKEVKKVIFKLGGAPILPPTFRFPFTDEAAFLALSQTFEDTGVGAYNGAAPAIESTEVLAFAGSIVQIEGRHAAAIRFARGQDPSPTAFEKPLSKQQVLERARPFIIDAS